MDLSHIIYLLDKRQAGPNAARCGNDAAHGRLTTHGTGQVMVCAVKTGPKTYCDFAVAVDSGTIAEAVAEAR